VEALDDEPERGHWKPGEAQMIADDEDDVISTFDARSISSRKQRQVETGEQHLAIADNDVPVRGDALGALWWRGAQWAVTEHGIECLDGTYSIAKDRLLEGPRNWRWPGQLSTKTWVDIDEFTTAWLIALALHCGVRGIRRTELLNLFGRMPPRRST
jgi:hypothetical protein